MKIRDFLAKFLIFSTLLIISSANADYIFPDFVAVIDDQKVNKLELSPIFEKSTMNQGTLKQEGWLWGLRANYDIISANNLYFGAEFGYKSGDLLGKLNVADDLFLTVHPLTQELIVNDKTKAKYADLWTEVRVGYTFSNLVTLNEFVTPYIIIGYEKEKNHYVSPTPINFKTQINYGYVGLGFISDFSVSNEIKIGLNAKFKWIFKAKNKTGGEEWIQDSSISNANHLHYAIEFPVTYLIAQNMNVSIAPLYEFKKYDLHKLEWEGKEKTQMKSVGGLLKFGYWF